LLGYIPSGNRLTILTAICRQAFVHPGCGGHFVVLCNVDVGDWPGKGGRLFSDKAPARIDEQGMLR
jgi:hypothetical protein